MSGYIVIDDELADEPSRRSRKKKPAPRELIDLADSSDDEPLAAKAKRRSPQQKQKQNKKKKAAAVEDSDSDEEARPAKKKPKKQQTPKAPKAAKEKRTNDAGVTVRYSAQPSQAVYQRIQRALPGSGHRMFLISTKQLAGADAAGGRAQEFVVLGATGNCYDVTIKKTPHCTCPDHVRGNLCKHVLFVYLRVLKMATTNPLVWQKALLTSEVEEILSGAHSQGVDAGVLAEEGVLRAYRAANGEEAAADGAGGSSNQRKPIEGDCPVCFNELDESEPLVFCRSGCGNNLHKQCFEKWAAAKRSSSQPVTCVYCRAPWPAGDGAGGGSSQQQYLNLAQHSHQYDAAATSLETLYPDSAMWIHHHSGGYGGYGGRGDTARMHRARN